MTKRKSLALIAVVALVAGGFAAKANYGRIAVLAAPAKQAATVRSPGALKADSLFWRTLHTGDYDGIPRAIEELTRAYVEAPHDAVTAAHLAWLHIWRAAERARLDTPPASITGHLVLARKYFEEAVRLDPADARYLGFLASAMLAEGFVDKNERLTRAGYFKLRESIDAWPEFNLFTGGYALSVLPATSPQYQEGLRWQWGNLDICVQESVDRADPSYAKYMTYATTHGPKRVCWNSWIAPHNFEGFFLNMGDMLVKAGDWRTARKIYENAKLSATYASWKFREVLEDRILNAERNVALFNAAGRHRDATIMVSSAFSCMGCHEQ
jgi:tetratricopeptide (TPR) repeat protein